MTTDDLILVIGGTGRTGRRVAERLTALGHPVRIGSRSADPGFDWENPDTWAPALAGVKAAYVTYYPDLGFPGADTVIEQFTKTAHEQGVARLVLLSGRGEEEAQVCERIVQRGGTEWTILRSAWFAQNFSENFLLEPVLAGEIALPAGDAVEAFVDLDDLADVAVAALTEDRHAGEVYELSGPRLISFHDAAAELSKATGREIRYIPVSAEEYAAMLREYGMPEDFVELFTKVLDGRNAHTTDGVQRALGRAPRDFADYARETAATGVWNAG
ncbi:NAD(P)H-binding protein [Actinokineospora sp. 24-640]